MAKKKCSVCPHAQIAEINARLESGCKQLEVAAGFSLSRFALSRHANKCLRPASTGDNTAALADKWLRRADEIWATATINGDVRGQAAALASAVRHLQATQKREEKQAEQEAQKPSGQLEVDRLDAVVAHYLDNQPPGACWHCGAPTEYGIYIGPAMPGTFPVLTGRDNSQPEPELLPEPLQEN
jgi:hypothetical protein